METKKKAEELVEKLFKMQVLILKDIGEIPVKQTEMRIAKQCAIICVDEIIKSHHSCEDCKEEGSIELRDWGRVKEHLNKM